MRSTHRLIQLPARTISGSIQARVVNGDTIPLNRGQVVRLNNAFSTDGRIYARLQTIDSNTSAFEEFTKTLGVVMSTTILPGEVGLIARVGLVDTLNVAQGGAVIAGEWLRPHRTVPGACAPIRTAGDMAKGWAFAIAGETKSVGSGNFDVGTIKAIILPWSV